MNLKNCEDLNQDWDAERDGGALRLYVGASLDDDVGISARKIVDVAPHCGTLVLFNSRVMLHEVLATHRPRHAISAWIETRRPVLDAVTTMTRY